MQYFKFHGWLELSGCLAVGEAPKGRAKLEGTSPGKAIGTSAKRIMLHKCQSAYKH